MSDGIVIDEKTVVFAYRRGVFIMLPPFELRLKVSGYPPVRVDEENLGEILREGEALPKAVIVFAFGDTYVDLVSSLVEEFPLLHVIYWYIPWIDSAPPKDVRVHLFNSMSPRELVAILEEC